jgi:phosphoribosylformylglycinamidine synthase
VLLGLNNLGIHSVHNVRVGKHIFLELEAESEAQAQEQVETACKKLLTNLIVEQYTYTLLPA